MLQSIVCNKEVASSYKIIGVIVSVSYFRGIHLIVSPG
jgi:hypothetical protein